ncbi:transglycosylase family protein [Streptomyces sp. YIM S03343]
MLSGNGRHRRPRQAPALIVAAGVTGSAIAIPLLGAASAHAADGTTWDKVAQCESDGAWSADIGNGRYGGLQITQADWEQYGGLDYAARADQASRQQQIAVAEKILADQGADAWATCGALYGLDKDSGNASVDTGVADDENSDSSSGSSDNSQSDENGNSGNSNSSDKSDSKDDSDSSDVPVSSGLSDSSTDNSSSSGNGSSSSSKGKSNNGKSDKNGKSDSSGVTDSTKSTGSGSTGSQSPTTSPTEAPTGDTTDDSLQADGTSALVDTGALGSGRHRGASDEGEGGLSSDSTGGRHASQTDGTYTVRAGDSLISITDALDLDGGWRHLYAMNKKTIGSDPDRITAGQTLQIGS